MNTFRKDGGMRKVVVPVLCILGFILMMSAVDTFAAPPTFLLVRGTYYVVGSHSCVVSQDGFNTDDYSYSILTPLGGSMRTAHYDGYLNLNYDGTGTYDVHETQYIANNINQGSRPMGYQQINCDVNYEKLNTGLFEITFSSCVGTNLAGVGFGNVTTYAPKTLSMAATPDGGVLVLSNTFPEVESFTRNVTPNNRLCSRTFTAVRQSFE